MVTELDFFFLSQISFNDSIDSFNRTDLNDLLKNQNDPVLKCNSALTTLWTGRLAVCVMA